MRHLRACAFVTILTHSCHTALNGATLVLSGNGATKHFMLVIRPLQAAVAAAPASRKSSGSAKDGDHDEQDTEDDDASAPRVGSGHRDKRVKREQVRTVPRTKSQK